MPKAFLSIEALGVSFPGRTGANEVLRTIDLQIDQGEFVPITTGAVILDHSAVAAPGPDRAVVFQNHSLLPWLSVYENVRLAVDKVFRGKKSGRERHDGAMENLALVQMTHAVDKRPSESSGGRKQRVGIARALAIQPK